jgi:hypothetical protein
MRTDSIHQRSNFAVVHRKQDNPAKPVLVLIMIGLLLSGCAGSGPDTNSIRAAPASGFGGVGENPHVRTHDPTSER